MVLNSAYSRFVAYAVLALSSAACASKASSTGDETHFQMCNVDDDCKNLGDAYRCESRTCRVPGSSGAGGAASISGALTALCSRLQAGGPALDGGVIERLLGAAAATCTLRASDYDRSCTKDADCTLAGEGNACEGPCAVGCSNTSINVSALDQYMADYERTPVAMCPNTLTCHCPAAIPPHCVKGTCELVRGPLSPADTGDGGNP